MLTPSDEYQGQEATLSNDQRAVIVRELKEQIFAFSHLVDLVGKRATVDKTAAFNVLYINESRNQQLAEILGVELDSTRAREDRYAMLRQANGRIKELETQLGQGAGPEQTKAHLKTLCDKLDAWWDKEGLGYIREASFSKYGSLQAKFSCRLTRDFSSYWSDTPLTDKENRKRWIDSLQQRGFVLVTSKQDRDPLLSDCDANRQLLRDLFKQYFPKAMLQGFASLFTNDGVSYLTDCDVHFNELKELDELPPMLSASAS